MTVHELPFFLTPRLAAIAAVVLWLAAYVTRPKGHRGSTVLGLHLAAAGMSAYILARGPGHHDLYTVHAQRGHLVAHLMIGDDLLYWAAAAFLLVCLFAIVARQLREREQRRQKPQQYSPSSEPEAYGSTRT